MSYTSGLRTPPTGEDHPRARITEDQARTILHRYWTFGHSILEIAEDVPIAKSTVWRLVNGGTWPELDELRAELQEATR